MSHLRFLRSADDVTSDYRAQNDCEPNTSKVKSKSSDTYFIHGDIHDQSCKKVYYRYLYPYVLEMNQTRRPIFQIANVVSHDFSGKD